MTSDQTRSGDKRLLVLRRNARPEDRPVQTSGNPDESPDQTPAPINAGLIAAAANMPDSEEGLDAVVNMAGHDFDAVFGAELDAAEREAAEIFARLAENGAELKTAREERQSAPEWVQGCAPMDVAKGEPSREVPVRDWSLKDKINASLYAFGIITVMFTSLLTAHGNLVGSGVPAFIENPLLPWVMAAIAPGASIAIKSMAGLFDTERTKLLFRKAVHLATGFCFFGWLAVFAGRYHGLSEGFDPFASASASGDWAFVMLQIGTEVLVGAALFLALEAIANRYGTHVRYRNTAYEAALERETRLEAAREALLARLAAATGTVTRLTAERARAIDAACLAFHTRRRRFDAGSDL
ncbi:MAG: hypothetical protein AAF416_18730 [Pseudomonadota bacterium]